MGRVLRIAIGWMMYLDRPSRPAARVLIVPCGPKQRRAHREDCRAADSSQFGFLGPMRPNDLARWMALIKYNGLKQTEATHPNPLCGLHFFPVAGGGLEPPTLRL
jgi:hypothetical protein